MASQGEGREVEYRKVEWCLIKGRKGPKMPFLPLVCGRRILCAAVGTYLHKVTSIEWTWILWSLGGRYGNPPYEGSVLDVGRDAIPTAF